jgi:GPH family glycoside/pentoside/hexuronide:cation symporter
MQVPSAEPRRIPLGTIVVYSLPAAAVHFTWMLTGVYLLKFTTDVLLVGPAVMSLLYGLSRLWDAVSDPLAGHLSDRTVSRLGRRRSWLLAAAVPTAAGFAMLWSPPAGLAGVELAAWLGAGVFVYFTGTTIFAVPHESLGAELSEAYHERTRIFGVRTAVSQLGSLLALGGMHLLVTSAAPRRTASVLAALAAVALVVTTLVAVARVRERPEYQGRGAPSLRSAFRDVWKNPYAPRLLFVFFVENFGTGILSILIPFAMEYVLGMKDLTTTFIAIYFVPALLFIPLWIRLAPVFGKKPLWVFSMSMMSVAFCGLFFVGEGDVLLVCLLGLLAGVGGGCGQVVGPSIQADVIDYDELRTGQRKEGAYFAVWNFVRKSAAGVATILSGVLLAAVGFEPNAVQSETARLGLQALFSFVPGLCYVVGTLAFLGFRLGEAEHAAIRRALDERA